MRVTSVSLLKLTLYNYHKHRSLSIQNHLWQKSESYRTF